MTDLDLAEACLELWFGDTEPPALFDEGRPTDRALRCYADGVLSPEDTATVAAAIGDPVHARHLARIIALRDTRKAAMLRDVTDGRDLGGAIVSVSASAGVMRHLARPVELSVAASALLGGVVQTTDADDLVTLRVVEVFEPDAQEGELEVEVRTFDEPALVNARGVLQVAMGDTTLHEYELELRDHHFEGRFPIRRIPHPSAALEFRLHLIRAVE